MNYYIEKLINFSLICTVSFSLISLVTAYAKTCDEVTEYCGQSLYLFSIDNVAVVNATNPNPLLAAQVCNFTQLFLTLAAYMLSTEWLDFEQIYAIALFLSVGFGASNVIVYWTSGVQIEQIMVQAFGDFQENTISAGVGLVLSGVVTLIHLILLFVALLFDYKKE
jgi:hypothetical protein